jgi:hypothetical protein
MKEKIKKIFIFIKYNYFKFIVIILLTYLIFSGKININFNISEGIIGLLGVMLGFVLWSTHDYYKEKKTKKNLFSALRNELVCNSRLIEKYIKQPVILMKKDKIKELRTVNFDELERTSSFVGLPSNLQRDIYDTYTDINIFKKEALSDISVYMMSDSSIVKYEIEKLINDLDQYSREL